MERGIDSMKYRESTHLAGIDVELIVAKKGKCILTIKDAFYDTKVNVSGNKTNAYFLSFKDDVKDMVVNSGNRTRIAEMVRRKNNCSPLESRNIGNWIGLNIELKFDPTITMMGKVTGGIVVAPIEPTLSKPVMNKDHKKWDEVCSKITEGGLTIDAIRKHYEISDEDYQSINEK